MAVSATSVISSPAQILISVRSSSNCTNTSGSLASNISASSFAGTTLRGYLPKTGKVVKTNTKIYAAAVAPSVVEELKEYIRPTWADFEIGNAPVFWKTMNGLPPTSGEKLKLFYNPAANKLLPNEVFGIAFNGGFNQPIMCGGEPRSMLRKDRGIADLPIYTIRICIPKHATSLIFSFTNGDEWDGPYKLEFQFPKAWKNKPITFFNEGLAEELSRDGACEAAIFPDSSIVISSCAMIGNLFVEGGDRCNLDLVPGCTDPDSLLYNPLANVDDGSCPLDSDSEE